MVLAKKRKPKGLFAARFPRTIFVSSLLSTEPDAGNKQEKHRKLSKDDYVMVYKCLNCHYDTIFDHLPIVKSMLEPVLKVEKPSITKEADPKAEKKKQMVGKILGKRDVPKEEKKPPSGLNLSSFLKKL